MPLAQFVNLQLIISPSANWDETAQSSLSVNSESVIDNLAFSGWADVPENERVSHFVNAHLDIFNAASSEMEYIGTREFLNVHCCNVAVFSNCNGDKRSPDCVQSHSLPEKSEFFMVILSATMQADVE